MQGLVLDIETCRIEGIEPPPPRVALGNLKDPLKIQMKEDAARQSQLGRVAMDPHYAAVAAVGIGTFTMTPDTGPSLSCRVHVLPASPQKTQLAAERNLVSLAMSRIAEAEAIVTYNGEAFDLPFLYRRAAILDVPLEFEPERYCPFRLFRASLRDLESPYKGWRPHSADVYRVLSESYSDVGHTGQRLQDYARLFGIEVPECPYDKAEIHALLDTENGQSQVEAACGADVSATFQLYLRLRRFYV